MRRILFLGMAALLICSTVSTTCLAQSEEDKGNGRYALYFLPTEKKQIPILLDTKTGKVWWYSEEQAGPGLVGTAIKPKFIGVTVEGLLYSQKDLGDFEKQIDLLHSNGFVNKDLKGFRETMTGEFSYSLDFQKLQGLYEKIKISQPKKE